MSTHSSIRPSIQGHILRSLSVNDSVCVSFHGASSSLSKTFPISANGSFFAVDRGSCPFVKRYSRVWSRYYQRLIRTANTSRVLWCCTSGLHFLAGWFLNPYKQRIRICSGWDVDTRQMKCTWSKQASRQVSCV